MPSRSSGPTAKYGVSLLVWYESHESRDAAFRRERQLKEWKPAWKIEMIERLNPGWRDLSEESLIG
jgi:putative endonuclease